MENLAHFIAPSASAELRLRLVVLVLIEEKNAGSSLDA